MIEKICRVSGEKFEITKEDLEFYVKMNVITEEDFQSLLSGKIVDCVGLPTLCPSERQRRRLIFRNFTRLYKRKCDATGKIVITNYHKEVLFPVYASEYWWGNNWNAMDYGQIFDFNESFFDQFKKLSNTVPRFSNYNINCENCDYATAFSSKNCYLIAGSVRTEDSCYGHIVWDSSDCFDNLYVSHCQWCSNCVDSVNCYETHFSSESANCSNSYFLHDCRNCENCFGCTNLRNKKYCFLNEQLTKQQYEEKISEITPLSIETIKNGALWLEKIKLEKTVFPAMFGLKNEDCKGNHIYESKNCENCFDTKSAEDCKYLYTTHGQKNCFDISFTGKENRFFLEGLSIFNCENSKFSFDIHDSSDMNYCSFCFSCQSCFGCTGLRNKKYCILNKQYTKEVYEELVEKIIEYMKKTKEWGEFFPENISPFGYNESVAQEYFLLTKAAVKEQGYDWKEEEITTKYKGGSSEDFDDIKEVTESVLKKILICERTGKPYKLQKSEFKFYRKMNLPIPRLHPDERHKDRMALRNPRKLWKRNCGTCNCEIQTTFTPERPERVLCEGCYLKVLK